MRGKIFMILFLLMVSITMFGCANQIKIAKKPMEVFKAQDLASKVKSGGYVKAVDNFIIILDRSQTMDASYKGRSKYELAKSIVSRMNQTIPDLDLMGALRTFGFGTCCSTDVKTDLIYGVTTYARSRLEDALKAIPYAGGGSPLGAAIDAAGEDLKTTQGNIAVIIVSDAQYMDDTPLIAARRLKRQYGDRVCIHTVQVGDDAAGGVLMKKIAEAGLCGLSVNADDIASSGSMADFVEKVFLTLVADSDGDGVPDKLDRCPRTPAGTRVDSVGCPLDSDGDGVYDDQDRCPKTPKGVEVDATGCPFDRDGDGVYDYLDQCPGTPRGVWTDSKGCPLDSDGDGVYDGLDKCPHTPRGAPVDQKGCPLDSDGDGVYDHLDQCPGTPRGATVDSRGCTLEAGPKDSDGDGIYDKEDQCPHTPKGAKVNAVGCWVLKGLLFDTARWNIKPKFYPVLDEVVSILNQNPDLKVEVQGHTDNRGSAAYNQRLSENRARSVMNYLSGRGIETGRLSAKGYGLTKPVASNDTAEGRSLNRRVELKPMW